MNHPFLQRAVEYWLDSANELTYQPLFCGWLVNSGFTVKHYSGPGQAAYEQGKDVIATNNHGAHAFQLKGGTITLKRWRAEVRPEVEELRDIPIKHPGFDTFQGHRSYLVTNGELHDSVRVQIHDLNSSKWKANPLIVWRRSDLLRGFLDMANGILPTDISMYRQLVNLMFADGTGPPNIADIELFFRRSLRIGDDRRREQRKRDIAVTLLYASLITGSYRRSQNHVAVIRVLVVFMSYILLLVDRYYLENRLWKKVFHLTWLDIISEARSLDRDVVRERALDNVLDPADTLLAPYRLQTASMLLIASQLATIIQGDGDCEPAEFAAYAEHFDYELLSSEASLLPLIFLTIIGRRVLGPEQSQSDYAKQAVCAIVERNGKWAKDRPGLLPPYFDVEYAVDSMLDKEEQLPKDVHGGNEDYRGTSYYLWPLVELLARHGEKEFLRSHWRDISLINAQQFIPHHSWQYYLWRSPEGDNTTIVHKHECRWTDLVKMAVDNNDLELPEGMRMFPSFIPLFLAVFPHRLDPKMLAFVDRAAST